MSFELLNRMTQNFSWILILTLQMSHFLIKLHLRVPLLYLSLCTSGLAFSSAWPPFSSPDLLNYLSQLQNVSPILTPYSHHPFSTPQSLQFTNFFLSCIPFLGRDSISLLLWNLYTFLHSLPFPSILILTESLTVV